MKYCGMCRLEKPESEFHKHRSKPSGLQARCKTCAKQYVDNNKESISSYKKHNYIKKFHGISLEERQDIGDRQDWKCAACGDEMWAKNGGVKGELDHDHITGKIRGLLCFHCNTALGLLKDDPSRILALLDYLKVSLC